MRFQELVSSPSVIQIGMFISRCVPRSLARALSSFVASAIARARPLVYGVMCENLRHVLGPDVAGSTVRRVAQSTFYHACQVYYDFFRALSMSPAQRVAAVRMPDWFVALLRETARGGRGLLLLGPHMSNFNLLMLAIRARGVRTQVLSLPDPTGGYQFWNRLLEKGGVRVTPISPLALRTAIRQLRAGGAVFTGVDLAVRDSADLIEFFGVPTRLGTGPARLSLATRAPVMVGCCLRDGDGRYSLKITKPIELERSGDRRRDALENTRHIVRLAEGFIRECPEQWLMFHPVWGEETV